MPMYNCVSIAWPYATNVRHEALLRSLKSPSSHVQFDGVLEKQFASGCSSNITNNNDNINNNSSIRSGRCGNRKKQ